MILPQLSHISDLSQKYLHALHRYWNSHDISSTCMRWKFFHYSNTIYTIIVLKYVAVIKLQVTIIARTSREMSQIVCIKWKPFLSCVCDSVRASNFFICEKHPETIAKTKYRASVCWMNHWAACRKGLVTPVTVDRSPVTSRNATKWSATTADLAATDWAEAAKSNK